MLSLKIVGGRLLFGDRFSASFQRTLRVPDDGRAYPLPPGLGLFPIHVVNALGGTFLVPLYQREALWIGFDAATWKPNAVKIAVGDINAISGEPWREGLHDDPQDYLVCPPQLWLDGINAGPGHIRQFVAVPFGEGVTIEEQLSGGKHLGGLQIEVFEPRPDRFPDEPTGEADDMPAFVSSPMELGMAAGGRIAQKVYRDPYGVSVWDAGHRGVAFVHLLNAEQYHSVTGFNPPPTPISARTYTEYGFPWFDLYDEGQPGIEPATPLTRVESIGEIGRRTGAAEDTPVEIPADQVQVLELPDLPPDEGDGI